MTNYLLSVHHSPDAPPPPPEDMQKAFKQVDEFNAELQAAGAWVFAGAKQKIRDAKIPYRVPASAELPDRLPPVLAVIYLIFNEGYTATEGDALIRADLCAEAIRLGRVLAELMPGRRP